MTAPNDSIQVNTGTGPLVATQLVGTKEYQVVMIAAPDGHLAHSNPVYRLVIPGSAVGANKVHADLFNATGSGVTIKVLSAFCYVDMDTAVTGTVGVEMALTRTTAVGTGGTAAASNGTALNAPSISAFDLAGPALSASITARSGPTAGATAGAVLGLRYLFTEETNAGAALGGLVGAEFVRNEGAEVIVRENSGLRFVQGAVASVGTLSFEITFEVM